MNLMLHVGLCSLLAVLTVSVSLYRKWLEDRCDHYIHLHNDSHDTAVVQSQADVCKRIEIMDKLKTGLLVATIVYALSIGAIASYLAWMAQPGS
jgi:hypothetical protein